jgi:hypothetical protein
VASLHSRWPSNWSRRDKRLHFPADGHVAAGPVRQSRRQVLL